MCDPTIHRYFDVSFHYVGDFLNIQNRSPTSQTCYQHIWSPTSVTNIDATTFLPTDVGDICRRQMLEMKCFGDGFEMLVTNLKHLNDQHYDKVANIMKKVSHIINLSPTSLICHHQKVIEITLSPTSL